MLRDIRIVAREMRERQAKGEPPFALFLGAGASLAPRSSASSKVLDEILGVWDVPLPRSMSGEERIEAFFSLLSGALPADRNAIVQTYLSKIVASDLTDHVPRLTRRAYYPNRPGHHRAVPLPAHQWRGGDR